MRFAHQTELEALQPIRTVAEVAVEFVVFTRDPFRFQLVRAEAERMRLLGMTYRAIGAALDVDEKLIRIALRRVIRLPEVTMSGPPSEAIAGPFSRLAALVSEEWPEFLPARAHHAGDARQVAHSIISLSCL